MTTFDWEALRADGRIERGQTPGATADQVARSLQARGWVPVRISDASGNAPSSAATAPRSGRRRLARGRLKQGDVIAFTRELSVLLRAGLPLDRSLRIVMRMAHKQALQTIAESLLKEIKAGRSLSAALAPHADLFGNFYINMIRSGEAGGNLAVVLDRLLEALEASKALRESVVSALIYPAILLFVAVASLAVMLAFVIPQFEEMFADAGEALPMATRVVIAMGDFAAQWWWAGLLAFIVLTLGLQAWVRQPAGRAALDRWVLRLPLAGSLVRRFEIARFSRTAGTLLGNGVAVLDAMRIAAATVGNQPVRATVEQAVPAIKQGQRVAASIASTGEFSEMAVQMIEVGEESGRLDAMLLELARVYDGEVREGIKRGLTFLEPALILGMGTAIALLIIAILMGILSVNDLAF